MHPFLRAGHYPLGRAVVRRLSHQLPAARRNDARAGVEVDHSSLNRWVIKYTPALDKSFRQRKRSVGTNWRLDETYIRVKGQWVRISSTGYYFRTRPFDILISLLGQRNLAP